MAAIDKTYADSYSDYTRFKDWADSQTITFHNGHTVCVADYVYEWEESAFSDGMGLPIMNTPTYIDIYLIQNCKLDFVIERLKAVYSKEDFNRFKTFDLTSKPPTDFQQNRKISIRKKRPTSYPLHSKPYKGKTRWWVQCNGSFGYDTKTKVWSSYEFPYPHNSNTARIKSIKGIVRHLRKQYLPKGLIFTVTGKYVGEDYLIKIS